MNKISKNMKYIKIEKSYLYIYKRKKIGRTDHVPVSCAPSCRQIWKYNII